MEHNRILLTFYDFFLHLLYIFSFPSLISSSFALFVREKILITFFSESFFAETFGD